MKRGTISCSWALVLSLAVSIHLADAASFDCAKASTPQEKLVCSTPALSAVDEQLGTIYRAQLARLADAPKMALRDSQREWLKDIKTTCL